MGTNTKIEWTDHTFNPWRGCTKVSDGCKNCYAEVLSHRNPKTLGEWGPTGARVIAALSYWKLPLKWNRDAEKAGRRARVFCASLADVFEDRPELNAPRFRLFDLINITPHLDWLLLTKRPENLLSMWPFDRNCAPPNIWLGTSVENQQAAERRIPQLLKVAARVHFLSCEPLLGPVDLAYSCFNGADTFGTMPGINWVIAGGESGDHARPMRPDWARSLRDQCQIAGVPFFFKQWGEYDPDGQKLGKKGTGNMLDGQQWLDVPVKLA